MQSEVEGGFVGNGDAVGVEVRVGGTAESDVVERGRMEGGGVFTPDEKRDWGIWMGDVTMEMNCTGAVDRGWMWEG